MAITQVRSTISEAECVVLAYALMIHVGAAGQ